MEQIHTKFSLSVSVSLYKKESCPEGNIGADLPFFLQGSAPFYVMGRYQIIICTRKIAVTVPARVAISAPGSVYLVFSIFAAAK